MKIPCFFSGAVLKDSIIPLVMIKYVWLFESNMRGGAGVSVGDQQDCGPHEYQQGVEAGRGFVQEELGTCIESPNSCHIGWHAKKF